MNTKQKRPRGRPKSQFKDTPPSTMQSLDRALGVLNGLSKVDGASLSDISLSLGIPTATSHRILATLQKHQMVEFDDETQRWMIGIEAYRIGSSYLKRTNLLDMSRPVMRNLMQETGETANLAIPDGHEVVFVGQVETQNPIRAFFNPGTRTSMHASGTGKAILATLDEARLTQLFQSIGLSAFTENTLSNPADLFEDLDVIRTRGWSYDQEERFLGMSCIGAAIFNSRGEAIGGVSISGPSNRFSNDRIHGFGSMVKRAAQDITHAIGGVEPKV